jgi:diguanylate cyclase (GGDEF)-like protein
MVPTAYYGQPGLSAVPVSDSDQEEFEALRNIIGNGRIKTVFQPIFHLQTGEVYGYEALSRILGDSPFAGPDGLFQAALRFKLTPDLEMLCSSKALSRATELGMETILSLNICPSILRFPDDDGGEIAFPMKELYEVRDRVVLELTERFYIRNNELFTKTVDYYRRQGFKIAIDDLGSGYAGLKMLAQIEPSMVKIDRFLISNIHQSTKKMMLLEAIVCFCHKINALVVAEGIETKDELEAVRALKVDLAQGYYLARPSEELYHREDKASFLTAPPQYRDSSGNSGNLVGSLVQFIDPVESDTSISEVVERFKNDNELSALPVLNHRTPVGVIHKAKLFYQLGQRFGYDLFFRKPTRSIMENALVFEFSTPLEDVSRRVLARDENSVYDDVIVVRNGAYLGIVKIYHILERITEQKINLAMEANPLTALPGNNLIKEEILNRLNTNQVFAVMYFDLDNFKPFNDSFGFEEGDRVIRFLGSLLKESLTQWDPRGFVGHVGGDDFVSVCRSSGIESLCESVIERFDHEVRRFHGEEAARLGYYRSYDRKGNLQTFPLLSVSIGVVTTSARKFSSYGHLVSVASEVKKKAKSIQGQLLLRRPEIALSFGGPRARRRPLPRIGFPG